MLQPVHRWQSTDSRLVLAGMHALHGRQGHVRGCLPGEAMEIFAWTCCRGSSSPVERTGESLALSLRSSSDAFKGRQSCALTSARRKAANRRVESRSPKDTRESLARNVRSCMMEMPTSSCCSSLSSCSISRRHCPSTRSSWQVRWCRNWTALQGKGRPWWKGSLGLSRSQQPMG